ALRDPDIDATLELVNCGPAWPEEDDADRTGSYTAGDATSEGQRFRILRPHAPGALSTVFVARDTEFNRSAPVARILRHHPDDPSSRQGFRIEAQVTGGLEHPGIVPVYGLGRYDDGRPYYAMRLIKGDTLKAVIDRFHADASLAKEPGRRSLELRKLLRRFV